ncbi:MAG: hypothetical protein KKG04_07730 [Candidatus Thermoplasmatota archaeon]|nr:hypothetical protein [Candidatus Thermoplasmatota archaeon]
MIKASKKLIRTIPRLIKSLGFIFLIWLFGILVLIPLADYIPPVKSFVGFIILIPVSILFFRSIKDMMLFSQITGKALYNKQKKIEDSKPYIHLCYACWISIGIILFAPLIYVINNVIGGIFLFGAFLSLIFIVFINLKYILASMLRYLYPD